MLLKFCRAVLPIFILIIHSLSLTARSHDDKVFYAEAYGVVGDGRTNNLQVLHRLANAVNANGGGRVVFPKGKSFLVMFASDPNGGYAKVPLADAMALCFSHCKNITVDLNGSIIQVSPNHSTKYSVIRFFDCKNFVVQNGSIVGDAMNHDYSPVIYKSKEYKTSHEWGYGIYCSGSTGAISNMKISYMTGDGLYVGSTSHDKVAFHGKTTIDSCEISYCRRNGITGCSSQGLIITNTNVHHIGTYGGMTGTAPMAGLDLEYEDGVGDRGDITIENCQFTDCSKWGIVTANSFVPNPMNFKLSNSTFTRATLHLNNMPKSKTKLVEACVLNDATVFVGDADVKKCEFYLGSQNNYISKTNFYDCDFVGLKTLEKGSRLNGFSMDKTTFEKCRFKDIIGNEKSGVVWQGFSGHVYPMNVEFKECTFTNTSFCRGGNKNDSRFYFEDCVFTKGCKILNLSKSPISFKNCSLIDVGSYATQSGQFSFDHCTIIQRDKTVNQPLLLFGTHTMKGCDVVDEVGISEIAKKKGVKQYKIKASGTQLGGILLK